jgi:hypothetical protein
MNVAPPHREELNIVQAETEPYQCLHGGYTGNWQKYQMLWYSTL